MHLYTQRCQREVDKFKKKSDRSIVLHRTTRRERLKSALHLRGSKSGFQNAQNFFDEKLAKSIDTPKGPFQS